MTVLFDATGGVVFTEYQLANWQGCFPASM